MNIYRHDSPLKAVSSISPSFNVIDVEENDSHQSDHKTMDLADNDSCHPTVYPYMGIDALVQTLSHISGRGIGADTCQNEDSIATQPQDRGEDISSCSVHGVESVVALLNLAQPLANAQQQVEAVDEESITQPQMNCVLGDMDTSLTDCLPSLLPVVAELGFSSKENIKAGELDRQKHGESDSSEPLLLNYGPPEIEYFDFSDGFVKPHPKLCSRSVLSHTGDQCGNENHPTTITPRNLYDGLPSITLNDIPVGSPVDVFCSRNKMWYKAKIVQHVPAISLDQIEIDMVRVHFIGWRKTTDIIVDIATGVVQRDGLFTTPPQTKLTKAIKRQRMGCKL